MQGIKITIVRYISEEDFYPGIVECRLEDVHGRQWKFVEKIPLISAEPLDAETVYPRGGVMACEVITRTAEGTGREVIRINTGIETAEGVTQFDVSPESLVDLNW